MASVIVRYAYQVQLPSGNLVRVDGKRQYAAAMASRIHSEWKVRWCASRRRAEMELRRFYAGMRESGLPDGQFEAHLLPVTAIDAPIIRWVVAMTPTGRLRTSYRPAWGESAPVAVVVVADENGWKAGAWVTSAEALSREQRRLRKTHDRVMVCDARLEGQHAST